MLDANVIVPAIMLIAVIWISYQLAKDKEARDEKDLNDARIRWQIEQKVYKTIKERAEYWDNFNVELYVNVLEKLNK